MTDNDDVKLATKEKPEAEPAPQAMRRTSTTSTLLPVYKAQDDPPPYKKESVLSSPRSPVPRSPTASGDKRHEGSCGMPASMVMGVMGSPAPSDANASSSKRDFGQSDAGKGGSLSSKARDRIKDNHFDRTRRRWNVQSTTLSDFGNPFRQSRK